MAKNCYAVRKGYQTGIFSSWDECQKAVKGYPGAEFMGFNTAEEANAYVHGKSVAGANKTTIIKRPDIAEEVNVFTDGSCKDGIISLGVYMEGKDSENSMSGIVNCVKYSKLNNIAGEIAAVLMGVQIAHHLGFPVINIFYDYQGIEDWYTGTWKAKGELQQRYVEAMKKFADEKNVNYVFHKVSGHSSVEGNKKADKLAAKARNMVANYQGYTTVGIDELLDCSLNIGRIIGK